MARAEKQVEIQFNPYAECLTSGCNWEHPESSQTRETAKRHASVRNHKVRIVQETVGVWCTKDYDKTDEERGL